MLSSAALTDASASCVLPTESAAKNEDDKVVATVPSASSICEDVPPDFTKVVAFNSPDVFTSIPRSLPRPSVSCFDVDDAAALSVVLISP